MICLLNTHLEYILHVLLFNVVCSDLYSFLKALIKYNHYLVGMPLRLKIYRATSDVKLFCPSCCIVTSRYCLWSEMCTKTTGSWSCQRIVRRKWTAGRLHCCELASTPREQQSTVMNRYFTFNLLK